MIRTETELGPEEALEAANSENFPSLPANAPAKKLLGREEAIQKLRAAGYTYPIESATPISRRTAVIASVATGAVIIGSIAGGFIAPESMQFLKGVGDSNPGETLNHGMRLLFATAAIAETSDLTYLASKFLGRNNNTPSSQ